MGGPPQLARAIAIESFTGDALTATQNELLVDEGSMLFEKQHIADVILITPKKFDDCRGYFMERFRQELFVEHFGLIEFAQDNQSLSAEVGTVRGSHFQMEPKRHGKLVRCIQVRY
jgi:dTDP-4-dehydrorhamnose 3,5-epimerase